MIRGQTWEPGMSRKHFHTEKSIGILREADVVSAQGMKVAGSAADRERISKVQIWVAK